MGVRVVKIGGAAVARPGGRDAVAKAVAGALDGDARGESVVLVHGGGPEIDHWSRRLGLEMERESGLRITTPEAQDVVEMVLAGRVNKSLVGALLDAGVDAVGLSGVDGGLFTAAVADGGRLGRVGRIDRVRAELVHALLSTGCTPVVAPVSRGPDGGTLNVNADEAAAVLAAALDADELLYLTDVPRVRDGVIERSTLSFSEARALVAMGAASDGMAVKLTSACAALDGGVGAVRIGPPEMLTNANAGTGVLATGEVPA